MAGMPSLFKTWKIIHEFECLLLLVHDEAHYVIIGALLGVISITLSSRKLRAEAYL